MPPFALRSITRFSCIGPTCEDTCCAGLQVTLEPAERKRLESALGPEAEAALERVSVGIASEGGRIRKKADGTCAFLEPTKLCRVHGSHGEATLPDVCAMFPRIVRGQGEDRTAVGNLACPELARLALLEEDGVDEVPLPEGFPVREGLAKLSFERTREAPYPFFTPLVIPALVKPWRLDRDVAETLAEVLAIGARLTPFFFHGTDAFADGRWDAAEQRLRGLLTEPAPPLEVASAVRANGLDRVIQLVSIRLRHGGNARMREVLSPVVDRWGSGMHTREVLEELDAVAQGLAAASGGGQLRTAIERAFRNYARSYSYQSHYVFHFDVLAFAQHLALRMACARALLFAQVAQGWPAAASAEEQSSWLKVALVDVFQVLTKYIDQDVTAFHAGLELSAGTIEERVERGLELAALQLEPS